MQFWEGHDYCTSKCNTPIQAYLQYLTQAGELRNLAVSHVEAEAINVMRRLSSMLPNNIVMAATSGINSRER